MAFVVVVYPPVLPHPPPQPSLPPLTGRPTHQCGVAPGHRVRRGGRARWHGPDAQPGRRAVFAHARGAVSWPLRAGRGWVPQPCHLAPGPGRGQAAGSRQACFGTTRCGLARLGFGGNEAWAHQSVVGRMQGRVMPAGGCGCEAVAAGRTSSPGPRLKVGAVSVPWAFQRTPRGIGLSAPLMPAHSSPVHPNAGILPAVG